MAEYSNIVVNCATNGGQAILPFVQSIVRAHAEEGKGISESTVRKRAREQLYKLPKTHTSYGHVLQVAMVQGTTGIMNFEHMNVFAFFSLAASSSKRFFEFMVAMSKRCGVLRFALYSDGVVPRNKLRPDNAGSFEAFRMQLLDIPQWMRSRSAFRWITLGYTLHTDMEDCGVTVSTMFRAVLRVLFRPGNDFDLFATGIILRHGTESHQVRMRFRCLPQDERAHKYALNVKGNSGCKPCAECDNCMGRCPFFEDASGFIHILSTEYHKCKRRTRADFFAMADDIAEKARHGTVGQRKLAEKAYGLTWDPLGLMWDLYLRPHLDMPNCIYWDWCHVWCASSGIGQLHVNLFVLRITETLNMELSSLDEFAASVKGLQPRLPKRFFAKRIVNRPGASLRGFASELLAAVSVLGLFVQLILKPADVLRGEVECFRSMLIVLTIFQRADAAQIPLLREKNATAQCTFQCTLPKLWQTNAPLRHTHTKMLGRTRGLAELFWCGSRSQTGVPGVPVLLQCATTDSSRLQHQQIVSVST